MDYFSLSTAMLVASAILWVKLQDGRFLMWLVPVVVGFTCLTGTWLTESILRPARLDVLQLPVITTMALLYSSLGGYLASQKSQANLRPEITKRLPFLASICLLLSLLSQFPGNPMPIWQTGLYGAGLGFGFCLASAVLGSLFRQIQSASLPASLRGTAIELMTAGFLGLAIVGFAGIL